MRRTWVVAGVISLVLIGLAGGYVFWSNAHAQTSRSARKPPTSSPAEHHDQDNVTKKTDAAKKGKSHEADEAQSSHQKPDPSGGTTTQPGSVIPDKSAELYAKVSGYLKELGTDLDDKPIDIGSRVKEGQVLAVIKMPELVKEVDRDRAALRRAKATVKQMEARITTATADFRAAEKMLEFRTKVYKRLDQLAKDEVMDMRVVDEKEEQMHATEEAKNAAEAKILQAEADLEEAHAEVELAEATLARAQVDLDYATIISPYDGIITSRNFWPGDFIRAHDEGGRLPILSVQKTDVMRVVVKIPYVDVPYVRPGNKATVTIANLPGKKFEGVISRIASAEDPMTRTMRVEIDLENEDGHLYDGMYGSVTIALDHDDSAVTKAER